MLLQDTSDSPLFKGNSQVLQFIQRCLSNGHKTSAWACAVFPLTSLPLPLPTICRYSPTYAIVSSQKVRRKSNFAKIGTEYTQLLWACHEMSSELDIRGGRYFTLHCVPNTNFRSPSLGMDKESDINVSETEAGVSTCSAHAQSASCPT